MTDPFGIIQQSHILNETVHTEGNTVKLTQDLSMKALCRRLCVLFSQPAVG